MNTDRWRIDHGYENALSRWHEPPMDTRFARLTAMGAYPTNVNLTGEAPVRLIQPDQATPLNELAEITLEDGPA